MKGTGMDMGRNDNKLNERVIAEMRAAHGAQCRVIDTLRWRVQELEAELDRLSEDSRTMDAIVAEQHPAPERAL